MVFDCIPGGAMDAAQQPIETCIAAGVDLLRRGRTVDEACDHACDLAAPNDRPLVRVGIEAAALSLAVVERCRCGVLVYRVATPHARRPVLLDVDPRRLHLPLAFRFPGLVSGWTLQGDRVAGHEPRDGETTTEVYRAHVCGDRG